ncbi:MAG: redoxin domain-containing protein, partial [Actinomycetota bacterium]|nr:redoxin domain-containing protein [Actinomycetota bacterium]
NYDRLQEMNTEVFGISLDSYASAGEFRKQLELPFDLLADWGRDVTPEFGAYNERQMVANRWSYLIDTEGVVRFVQHSTLNEARDIDEMLAAVEELSAAK